MLTDMLGFPPQVLFGQLLLGLINGAFYAVLSLGLAVIFGLLNIVNFAHGALYMLGAFATYFLLQVFGIGYWGALILAPLMVGAAGILIERFLLRRLTGIDHLYGLLLTFGLALVIEGLFVKFFGASGIPYPTPEALKGGVNLGFMFSSLLSRLGSWFAALIICACTWWIFERTKVGAYLRAGTENPTLLQAFGVNVPLLTTLAYGYGVALAGFAGVLAAPITQVNPLMGANLIIVVFAVVVIGGMGSIMGAALTGLAMGVIEGLTKVFWPEASATVIFVIMAIVLVIRPAGLFGRPA